MCPLFGGSTVYPLHMHDIVLVCNSFPFLWVKEQLFYLTINGHESEPAAIYQFSSAWALHPIRNFSRWLRIAHAHIP